MAVLHFLSRTNGVGYRRLPQLSWPHESLSWPLKLFQAQPVDSRLLIYPTGSLLPASETRLRRGRRHIHTATTTATFSTTTFSTRQHHLPSCAMPQQHLQDIVLRASLDDAEGFWSRHAERLHWHRKPSRALSRTSKTLPSGATHDHWSWFPDGEISTAYNCIDRHVESGKGDHIAIIWDSPVTGSKEKYTYRQLLDEVEVLAGVLREEGVQKGDVVIIYSMILENSS